MEKKKKFERMVPVIRTILVIAIACCGIMTTISTSDICIPFYSTSVVARAIGNETVSIEFFLEDLAPYKTFLDGGAVADLDLEHLTGEFEGGTEIREPYNTEVTWANLCNDLTVDTLALIVQIPQGIDLEDIGVTGTSQNGTTPDVQVEEVTGALAAIAGKTYAMEEGQKLFMISLDRAGFNITGWIDYTVTINNIAFTNDEFHIKGIIAAKVMCGDQTLYVPILPATYKFADVPALVVYKNQANLGDPTADDLPAPSNDLAYITDTNYAGGAVVDNNDDNDDGDDGTGDDGDDGTGDDGDDGTGDDGDDGTGDDGDDGTGDDGDDGTGGDDDDGTDEGNDDPDGNKGHHSSSGGTCFVTSLM